MFHRRQFVDNGLHQIYINAHGRDGSRISRLMKHFNEPDFSDEETMKYSDLSEDKIIEEVVNRFNITKEEAKEYYDECSSLE